MPEQRRTSRKRSFKAAYVGPEGAPTSLFCVVRDLSPEGARLELNDGDHLPATFDLHISGRDRVYRAEIVWRRPHDVGVRFVTTGRDEAELRAC